MIIAVSDIEIDSDKIVWSQLAICLLKLNASTKPNDSIFKGKDFIIVDTW